MAGQQNANKTFLFKLPQADLDASDIWKGDRLERSQLGAQLSAIIKSAHQSFVLGLDGEYGSGKTFFLTRLKHMLNELSVVYMDAWSSDFSGDPMAAFISALDSQLAAIDPKPKQIKKKLGELAKAAAPIMVRAGARKVLGEEGVKEFIDEFGLDKEQISGALKDYAAKRIKAQREAEKSVDGFKKKLESIAAEQRKNGDGPGILILVDELDRCRPSYAIEFLEHIKHFFAVEGVVFVIATDRAQLQSSIMGRYGSSFDADGYLRRFFDWWIRLPPPDYERYAVYLADRFSLVADGVLSNAELYDTGATTLAQTFAHVSEREHLSLREQEQVFVDINAALRASNRQIPCFAYLLPIIAIAHHKRPDACRAFCTHGVLDKGFLDWLVRALQGLQTPRNVDPKVLMLALYWNLTDKHIQYASLVSEQEHEDSFRLRGELLRSSGIHYTMDESVAGLIYSQVMFWSRVTRR